jgi:putative copper resistance protein D
LTFAAGLVAVAAAIAPPVAGRDEIFSVHVVQHLLLTMVAPPLLALAAPVTLALQAAGPRHRRQMLRALHRPPVRALTNPVTAWVVFSVSMASVYLTPLYPLSLSHPVLHAFLHLHMLVAGVLFWWPVVGLDPGRRPMPHGGRLVYVLTALPVHGFVAVVLLGARSPVAPAHTLADQQVGAGIMWAAGDLIALAALGVVVAAWIRSDEREAARIDRLLAAAPPSEVTLGPT